MTTEKLKSLSARAPAKVNLALHVMGQLGSGVHRIDTVAAFAPEVCDAFKVVQAPRFSLEISGRFARNITRGANNTILRAAQSFFALARKDGITMAGANMNVIKALPVNAGIGGSSSNAATTIKLLANLWDYKPDQKELHEVLRKLGNDVPICFYGKALHAEGLGDLVTPLPNLPSFPVVLVNPGIELKKERVFDALENKRNSPLGIFPDNDNTDDWIDWVRDQRNDLQEPACDIAKPIEDALSLVSGLAGCHVTRMTGSGPTVFGLFTDIEKARKAVTEIESRRGNWWTGVGTLR